MKKTLLIFAIFPAALSIRAATYYASPAGGGDGSSPSSPATLADAVASAVNPRDEVVLADGEYPLTAQITIDRDITVRGTSRDGTVVKRSGSSSFRLFSLNSSGAVLSTMTVSGGSGVDGANVLINTGGGTVTNCVLRNGRRDGNGTGGAAACLKGGLLTHCLITNNLSVVNANDHSGAAVWFKGCSSAKMSHCILANNESRCNRNSFVGAAATAIYNDANGVVIDSCTFADNRGVKSGGIYAATPKTTPIVTNCLFTGNVAVRSSVGNRDYTGSFKAVSYCAFDADATKTGTAHGVKGHNALDPATFAPSFASVCVGARADGGDIGAVQHVPSAALAAYAEVAQTRHAAPFETSFMVYANVANATCAWNFGDGVTDTSATGLKTHTYSTPGTYTPTLTVSDGNGRVSVPLPAIIVRPATYEVSDATALRAALADAADGSTIIVAPGTYTFAKSIGTTRPDFSNGVCALWLTNAVHLTGATGNPDDVVFTVSGNSFANLTSSSRNQLRLLTVNHPRAVVDGVSFRFGSVNGVYYFGAGVFVDYSGGLVSNCVITGCSSFDNASGGAGLGLYGAGKAVNCVITNNYSKITGYDNHGGAVLMYNSAVTRGCLIAHNDAKANAASTTYNVGGVALYGSSVLESCTIAGNTAFGCGGVRQYSDSATVRNCQIQGNSSSGYASDNVKQQYYASTASLFVNCACSVAISGGTDCLTGDLPVADADNGNWRPAYGSVAIGNALVQPWMAGAADLDGHPRLSDGAADIGAYQYQAQAVNGSFSLSGSSGAIPYPVDFSANASSPLGEITAYVWDFGDGSEPVMTATPETSHTYTTIGTYTPVLNVVIGGRSYTIDSVLTVTAGPDFIYVVNATHNPGAAYPYRTWETATTNLATALSAAVDGTVITLSRGVHTNRFAATVDKGVTIRGETGNPADTRVHRVFSSNTCRTFVLSHADALVTGLTISGGRISHDTTTYGAGLLIQGYGGTVSNCVFTGNSINGGSPNASAGAAAALLGGLVTHCVFTNNLAKLSSNDNGTGGAILRVFSGARAAFCVIANNRIDDSPLNSGSTHFSCAVRLSGGTLDCCTIASNDVSRGWALATTETDKGTFRNCLVAGNRSSSATALNRVFQSDVYSRLNHCCGDVAYAGADVAKWRAGENLLRDIEARDWRPALRADNPAIGKALVTDALRNARDLLGQPMVGSNGKADIGAFRHLGDPATFLMVK